MLTRHQIYWHLSLGPHSIQDCEESKCLCLSHPVCSVLLHSSSSRLRQLSIPEVSVPDQMRYISFASLVPSSLSHQQAQWRMVYNYPDIWSVLPYNKGDFCPCFLFPEFLRIFVKISPREGLVMRCLCEGVEEAEYLKSEEKRLPFQLGSPLFLIIFSRSTWKAMYVCVCV